MRALGRVIVVAVCSLGLAAWACDRSPSPFELDLGTALAASDVVFVAKVKEVSETSALVDVVQVLRGALSRSRVELGGTGPTKMLELCAGTPLIPGKEVIAFAWGGQDDAKVFLLDPFGGLRLNTPEWRQKVKATPLAPMSPWTSRGPVQSRLFRAVKGKDSNELDLLVLLRNAGAAPITFEYSDWPEATASTCSVTMRSGTSTPVAGKPVPIPRADLEAYFSKHGRQYTMPIPPGGSHVHRLQRVTSAAPGWGYKEELAFTFWPLTTRGRYDVSVECRNVFGPGSTVQTGPVALDL